MKLAVIFIATAFEVRLRNKEKTFLKQHERFRMAVMLDELDKWVSESVHSPEITVVTCYDEIYAICVRRHFRVIRNDVGQIAEGNMIRSGMLAMPGYDTFMVISASEPRLIKSGLFENLCGLYISQSEKTAVTKYKGRLVLPLIFSAINTDPVNSMLDKEKGRFVLHSGQKNTIHFEVTEEFLGSPDPDRRIKDYLSGVSAGLTGEEEDADVIIVRGGGRIGSGIALALFESGSNVLITEKEEPDTLYRGMSYASAVRESEITVNGVTGYLVSPGIRQLDKAWKAGVIPVVIDPELSCAGLFGTQDDTAALSAELDKPTAEAFEADLQGDHEDARSGKTYKLAAVIDCTSPGSGASFPGETQVITIGIKGNDYGNQGPKYLLDVSFGPRYATISLNRDIRITRVDSKLHQDEVIQDTVWKEADMFEFVRSCADGRFREIKRIGDMVKVNDLIGQIATSAGNRTDIFSDKAGRVAGNFADNGICLAGDIVCALDGSAASAQDCFSQSPLGMLPGISVRKLIDSDPLRQKPF